MSEKKIFVIDTNVLIHDPDSLDRFSKDDIRIPIWVIGELDRLKHDSNRKRDISKMCHIASDKIEAMEGKGLLSVELHHTDFDQFPQGLERNYDARIILTAQSLQSKHKGRCVVLVTKDANMRIIAKACGVIAEDYKSDKIIKSVEDVYRGVRKIIVENRALVQALCEKGGIDVQAWEELRPYTFALNECCVLTAADNFFTFALYKKGDMLRLVKKPSYYDRQNRDNKIVPINDEQAFAYALLKDQDIHLVSMAGPAGTGKTLISLLAGLEQLHVYEQILVYRANIEIGQSLGYLPGTQEEKFDPWKQPVVDNMRLLFRRNNIGSPNRKKNRKKKNIQQTTEENKLKQFFEDGRIEISPIAYIRGRTLAHRFVIIDDVQNLTPHEVKTIITRMGAGSKVVLTGDIEQIDNRYLDSVSNGLSYSIGCWRGNELFGHIAMKKGERSVLAETAVKLM